MPKQQMLCGGNVCVRMLRTVLMLVWHQFVTGELFVPDRRKELVAMKALSMFLCAERHLGSERTVKSSFLFIILSLFLAVHEKKGKRALCVCEREATVVKLN
jgi:hypothetical protein